MLYRPSFGFEIFETRLPLSFVASLTV